MLTAATSLPLAAPQQAEIPLKPLSGSEAVKPQDGADGCCRKSRANHSEDRA
jgi:hypothetical protein